MFKKKSNEKNTYGIVGLGRFGHALALELAAAGADLVKKAFEALPQVIEAEVSHEKKQAVLTLSGELSDKEIKNTVKEAGYKVTSIR